MTERSIGVTSQIIPNPDPSIVTAVAIDRAVENAERVISARIDGMAKAVEVFQSDLTRVPTQLDRAIISERAVLESKFHELAAIAEANKELAAAKRDGIVGIIEQRLDGMDKAIQLLQTFTDKQPQFVREQVMHLRELHEAGFESIKTQFMLLKQATEQLDLANKTAIAAALQAQKESAGETQKSSQTAIAKSENSTSEAIKALTTAFNAAITAVTDRINELKGRMDRGEGKTGAQDPAIMDAIRQMAVSIDALKIGASKLTGHSEGLSQVWGAVVAVGGLAVAAAAIAFHLR